MEDDNWIELTELIKTSGGCPSQWSATTADDKYLYIKYRHGLLYVQQADSEEAWSFDSPGIFSKVVTEENDGFMTTEEMLEITGLKYGANVPFILPGTGELLEVLIRNESM